MERLIRFFCSKIVQRWNKNYEIFPKHKFLARGRGQENCSNVLLMLYFYFKKVKNKWKIKKWRNEKITSNTSFRLISFRQRNVFQTRWMMPAACCLKRKQSFSQKWELCMNHHFYLFCHYFYFHSLPLFVESLYLLHVPCITLINGYSI